MKPFEILSALPAWAGAVPGGIPDSPAFAFPCRFGGESATLRPAAVRPADTLDLSILFGEEQHVLSLARSPRFPELDRLWESRSDLPDAILLALAEKECGEFFQLLENAVRRQLRLVSLAAEGAGADALALEVQPVGVPFLLTRSETVVSALGSLRSLDLSHPALRAETLDAETEFAAFSLPAADLSALAPGDALLLPEIDSVPPRLVADGRFTVDGTGVSPFAEDGRCRVVAAEPRTVTLGELFDAADDPHPLAAETPGQLRLVQNGRTVARGRLERLGDQNAFAVEAVGE